MRPKSTVRHGGELYCTHEVPHSPGRIVEQSVLSPKGRFLRCLADSGQRCSAVPKLWSKMPRFARIARDRQCVVEG